ncbi:four helix bundle protein [Salinibacter ruber]|uniref:four helix bundle protein n=1 Tax=Salinibacter ruber TaxID=146919 RepID=UPI002167B728|nr:four helix bundle protein [Salinibacter ruber]MCS3657949.1 four helix bundle protein [Salinibacter ruber]MCS4169894.1 four helix bundle protein [Salinibacter ruber]
MAETFEDLRVWQTARALTNAVYEHTKTGAFSQDVGLRDQIQRAAVSIMSNVAEGFESRTRSQFIHYLGQAKASAGEVRCQLYVAKDQGYIDQDTFEELSDDAEKITRQLYRLIEHLENSSSQVSDIDKEYLAPPE